MKPLLTVVIPVYNVEKYLKRCIDSILVQEWKHYDILLVDDGSTDNSPQICDDYAKAYDFISVFHKENGGLSAARNTGISHAEGEYVYFPDSDDWIEPNTFSDLAEVIESDQYDIISFNREFVKSKGYERFITNKYPDKKIAIVSCMDTRLTELLPAALGIKNGDVKIIKNAGAIISHPFGSVIRSLLVAIYELGVNEVMIVGHTDCGAKHMDSEQMIEVMKKRGIPSEHIDMMRYCGIDFKSWLRGFDTPEGSVRETVAQVQKHPLIPKDITVRGFVIDSTTGELATVV